MNQRKRTLVVGDDNFYGEIGDYLRKGSADFCDVKEVEGVDLGKYSMVIIQYSQDEPDTSMRTLGKITKSRGGLCAFFCGDFNDAGKEEKEAVLKKAPILNKEAVVAALEMGRKQKPTHRNT